MRHSRVSKDELISDVLEWAPAYGETIVGRLERTYILQVCADTGFIWEEQPGAMDDWDGFRERQRLREREREREKSVIYIYIYIHIYFLPLTFSLDHNCSVWLVTRDASSWDRNPADFTSFGYLTPKISSLCAWAKEFSTYIFIYIYAFRLLECSIHLKSFVFTRSQ